MTCPLCKGPHSLSQCRRWRLSDDYIALVILILVSPRMGDALATVLGAVLALVLVARWLRSLWQCWIKPRPYQKPAWAYDGGGAEFEEVGKELRGVLDLIKRKGTTMNKTYGGEFRNSMPEDRETGIGSMEPPTAVEGRDYEQEAREAFRNHPATKDITLRRSILDEKMVESLREIEASGRKLGPAEVRSTDNDMQPELVFPFLPLPDGGKEAHGTESSAA